MKHWSDFECWLLIEITKPIKIDINWIAFGFFFFGVFPKCLNFFFVSVEKCSKIAWQPFLRSKKWIWVVNVEKKISPTQVRRTNDRHYGSWKKGKFLDAARQNAILIMFFFFFHFVKNVKDTRLVCRIWKMANVMNWERRCENNTCTVGWWM